MFMNKNRTPEVNKIKELLENDENWARKIDKLLAGVTIEQRWELVCKILPELERNKARDLMRLLFEENQDFLRDKLQDVKERLFAIDCLSYFSSRETVKILVGLLQHKDSNTQLCAAGALKNQTPRLVVPFLVKGLLHEEVLPARAGEVLLAMGSLAQEAIFDAYPLALPKVRIHLLELLVQGNNPRCKSYVLQALDSTNTALVNKALDAVLQFGFTDLWFEVVACMTHTSWNIKAKALNVLEGLAVEESREYIEPFLVDEDPWIRECAERCLRTLRGEKDRTESVSFAIG